MMEENLISRIHLSFTASTQALRTQQLFESKLQKINKSSYGVLSDKKVLNITMLTAANNLHRRHQPALAGQVRLPNLLGTAEVHHSARRVLFINKGSTTGRT